MAACYKRHYDECCVQPTASVDHILKPQMQIRLLILARHSHRLPSVPTPAALFGDREVTKILVL